MSNTGLSANSQNIKKFQLQQKGRNLLLVLVIAVPIFIGGVIFVMFQQYTDESTSAELVTDYGELGTQGTTSATNPDGSVSAPVYVPPTDTSSGSSGSTSPSSSGSPATTNQAAGIPNGVSVAMNSIEANGIGGSSYISENLDTSSIPPGSTVKFDRTSWSPTSDTTGNVNGVVTALGSAYQGSVTFTNYSGVWKVSGYSLGN